MSDLKRCALLGCLSLILATACSDDSSGEESGSETSGDGDTTTGDGDGDTSSGDGDGDSSSGDGDGDTSSGDGDGDSSSGDGDGDGSSGDGDGDTSSGDGDGDTSSGDGDGDPSGCGPGLMGGCPPIEGDAFFLLSAQVVDDCLTLEVEYGGGCEEHTYQPCWDESFLESEPVQANLQVIHDANGDPCEAIEQASWTIDLQPLAQAYQDAYQAQSGTIIINVAGESLQYDF